MRTARSRLKLSIFVIWLRIARSEKGKLKATEKFTEYFLNFELGNFSSGCHHWPPVFIVTISFCLLSHRCQSMIFKIFDCAMILWFACNPVIFIVGSKVNGNFLVLQVIPTQEMLRFFKGDGVEKVKSDMYGDITRVAITYNGALVVLDKWYLDTHDLDIININLATLLSLPVCLFRMIVKDFKIPETSIVGC